MPVDKELAYESLKWVDPKTYRAYLRIKYREISDEEFKRDIASFYKLWYVANTLEVLDSLEQRGFLEVFNDYDNERVLVKIKHNQKSEEHAFIV
jgi:hypothetical protein